MYQIVFYLFLLMNCLFFNITQAASRQDSQLHSSTHAKLNQVVIDLMVLYTPAIAKPNGYEMNHQAPSNLLTGEENALLTIQHLIGLTNKFYKDSGISLKLRLVFAKAVDYPEDRSNQSALNDLRYNLNLFNHVERLRASYGADMVVLLRPNSPHLQNCGMAMMGPDKRNMYSVVNTGTQCRDDSFAHELGHNMGLLHSTVQGGHPEKSYALGYGVLNSFATIMTYPDKFGLSFSNYKFSNPRMHHCGKHANLRCGSFEEGDAVRQINEVKQQIADYYPTKVLNTFKGISAATAQVKLDNYLQSQEEAQQKKMLAEKRQQAKRLAQKREKIRLTLHEKEQAKQKYIDLYRKNSAAINSYHKAQHAYQDLIDEEQSVHQQVNCCWETARYLEEYSSKYKTRRQQAYDRYLASNHRNRERFYHDYLKTVTNFQKAFGRSLKKNQACTLLKRQKNRITSQKDQAQLKINRARANYHQIQKAYVQARIDYNDKIRMHCMAQNL